MEYADGLSKTKAKLFKGLYLSNGYDHIFEKKNKNNINQCVICYTGQSGDSPTSLLKKVNQLGKEAELLYRRFNQMQKVLDVIRPLILEVN